MKISFTARKAQEEIRRQTDHIRPDPRPQVELSQRDHIQALFLRLIPALYDYPGVEPNELVRGVALKLTAAEIQYLIDRLALVRKNRDVMVISRGQEDILLPIQTNFDPRKLPLAAIWSDGGFYTDKERANSNQSRLRKLGLRDGIAGYASYRCMILNPPVGRSSWQTGPEELRVASSYEAEAVAVELALIDLIGRLEDERNLPAADQFHVVLFSDCQSLITAIQSNRPPKLDSEEAAAPTIARIRILTTRLGGFHPRWEMRRHIKQRLGH